MNFTPLTFEKVKDKLEIVEFNRKIKSQEKNIKLVDGEWFIIEIGNTSIAGNFYMGINMFTDLKEAYFNIYLPKSEVCNLDEIIYFLENMYEKDTEDIDWIYLELFISNLELRETLINTKQSIGTFQMNTIFIEKLLLQERKFVSRKVPYETKQADLTFEKQIVESLVIAYLNGISKEIQPLIDKKLLIDNVKSYYTPFINSNRHSIVALDNNKFIGHGSFEILSDNNEKTINLIDILVLEDYRGKGISHLITKEIENYCWKENITKILGTLVFQDEDNTLRTFESLKNNGWKPHSIVFQKKMKVGVGNVK